VTVAYHVKAVSHAAFDERGMYLITVGGHDKITLAAWRVKDLIEAGKRDPCSILKGPQPICEFMVGKINVNCLKFDNENSDYNTLNIALGVERGVKFFTIKTNDRVIEEKMATLKAETLNNVFDIFFSKDDAFAAGDNGQYYTFRADKVADSNIQCENSSIHCIGMMQRNGEELLYTLAEEGKLNFWNKDQLVEKFELFDDEVKSKLGSENIKMKPKAFACYNQTAIIGFE
jgi:hypothetical protein